MIEKLIFYFVSLIAVSSTVYVIFSKDMFKSFIAVFLVFLSTAVIYFLMGFAFLGVFQLIIYAGAIMVLFITAMNSIPETKKSYKTKHISILFSLFISVLFVFLSWKAFKKTIYSLNFSYPQSVSFMEVSKKLFNDYPIQIEVVSLILFVAAVIVYSFLKGEENEL
ncbi:MAG TPA: NADH-quinone oxidoreductase subunit J [Elusimicrobiales bacterium]|nr:NADH-quinone oxidoreductase subunit J [Elusimicrobiales bacterium]HOL63320.1 NADH-quinone oxidoreductase subunit J [Elusimicrobiales bacterium]HPO95062.1 NADH-quinone oxidoreductase subunit J [Elusimicrobiales bacterium]